LLKEEEKRNDDLLCQLWRMIGIDAHGVVLSRNSNEYLDDRLDNDEMYCKG